MPLQTAFGERTINELALLFRNRQINLEPGFQRKSVWSWNDRRRLIQSILSGCPVPSIFLYKRESRGRLIYDVIDGKQRLEAILMFLGQGRFKRDQFDLRLELRDGRQWYDWRDLRRDHKTRHEFETYKIQTVEVTGELREIIDLFVSINSTGKRLTSGERRHARFYESRFLKEAERLVKRYDRYFLSQKILSKGQLERMKGTELLAELLMSVHQGGVINKKTALDRAIGNDSVNAHSLGKVSRECIATMNGIKKMCPEIKTTRFHNTVDFYSLFMIVWEMRQHGLVLNDRRRIKASAGLLRKLSTGVDELRDQLRRAKPALPSQQLYSDYLLTVQGDTDSAATRERRRELLRGLLFSIFERKDGKRTFTSEQRRLIWNTADKQNCRRCHKALTWDDFTVDHILAHARGGKTVLKNAQMLCRSCNSRKGAR